MYIIMLGKPGSGKGTVGKMLSEELGIVHISSGDLFRSYVKNAGKIGEEIERYISKGNLVPDELAIKLVEKRLSEKDCENGVILDGFPRTKAQAKELDRFLNEKHQNNHNIRAKIRQQLQILRDKGFIKFVGKGKYMKV